MGVGSLTAGREGCQPMYARELTEIPPAQNAFQRLHSPCFRFLSIKRVSKGVVLAKRRTVHACQSCGAQHPQWHGRCPDCGQWDSLVEETYSQSSASSGSSQGASLQSLVPAAGSDEKPRRLSEIDADSSPRISSGSGELDRVLGGGFVPGSVVLLGGDPGIGKSTLALQVAGGLAAEGRSVLYVSGEESAEQIRLRAERLPGLGGSLQVLTSTRVEALAGPWRELEPSLVVVDSIQTIQTEAIDSAARCSCWLGM